MSRPLNILTLSTLFPSAASPNFGIFIERQTAELASRSEANVTVINPVGVPPWPLSLHSKYAALKKLAKQEQWRGLNVYRPQFMLMPKFGGPKNPARITSAILPLVKRLHSQHPFDLIDAEFFYPDGPAAMRIAQALGIPFTVKARGADIHYWGSDPKCRTQILEAADGAAAMLAVSEALKNDMVALGMEGHKITVHYTGLDQKKFKPIDRVNAKHGMGIDGPLFISAGALIPRKNQNLIIRAMPEFPDATLLLAGQGEEEGSYRALAKDVGVENRVRFLGNVAHDELPVLIGAADISILASESEGLANVWVEALSCGTPIIISEAGGARELVKSDSAGRIVERKTPAIVEAIKSILAAPPSQKDVRQNVSEFSWSNNGDQLLRIFQNVTDT